MSHGGDGLYERIDVNAVLLCDDDLISGVTSDLMVSNKLITAEDWMKIMNDIIPGHVPCIRRRPPPIRDGGWHNQSGTIHALHLCISERCDARYSGYGGGGGRPVGDAVGSRARLIRRCSWHSVRFDVRWEDEIRGVDCVDVLAFWKRSGYFAFISECEDGLSCRWLIISNSTGVHHQPVLIRHLRMSNSIFFTS